MSNKKSEGDKTCRVLLRAASNCIDSIGIANVQLQPAKCTILGIDLPEPQEFGSKYTKYIGWVVDKQSENKFGIEMTKALKGIWIGEGSNDLLVEFDEVLISPEPEASPVSQTGPTVLVGLISSCFIY